MAKLKYTLIDTREQYNDYCDQLEELVMQDNPDLDDEIRLLTHLIENWDREHSPRNQMSPVELLRHLMNEHNISASELARNIGRSKSLLSDILSYRKSFSKEMIRDLAVYFKVSQEGFNREYPLQKVTRVVVESVNPIQPESSATLLYHESTAVRVYTVSVKGESQHASKSQHFQPKSPKQVLHKSSKKH